MIKLRYCLLLFIILENFKSDGINVLISKAISVFYKFYVKEVLKLKPSEAKLSVMLNDLKKK